MPRGNAKVPVPLRLAQDVVAAIEARRAAGQTRTDVVESILRGVLLDGKPAVPPPIAAAVQDADGLVHRFSAVAASSPVVRKAPRRAPDATALCPTHSVLVRSGHKCMGKGCDWRAP